MQDTVTLQNASAANRNIAPWTMEELVNDTLLLKELLIRETAALRSMDIATVRLLHDDKLRLIRKLELQKELLARDPWLMQGVDAIQQKRLKDAGHGMERVMKENFHEVLKAREVNACVVRAVSSEAKKYEQRATGYNRRGLQSARQPGYGNYDSAPSVALNQMI